MGLSLTNEHVENVAKVGSNKAEIEFSVKIYGEEI